jgi:hypothetical protein
MPVVAVDGWTGHREVPEPDQRGGLGVEAGGRQRREGVDEIRRGAAPAHSAERVEYTGDLVG